MTNILLSIVKNWLVISLVFSICACHHWGEPYVHERMNDMVTLSRIYVDCTLAGITNLDIDFLYKKLQQEGKKLNEPLAHKKGKLCYRLVKTNSIDSSETVLIEENENVCSQNILKLYVDGRFGLFPCTAQQTHPAGNDGKR